MEIKLRVAQQEEYLELTNLLSAERVSAERGECARFACLHAESA